MLPRNRRVSKSLFNEAMKGGKTFHSPHFLLRLSSGMPQELSRCAITISKKVDTRATERNRLRRKLSSYIEEILATLPSGYIVLISVKKGLTRSTVEECGAELVQLVHRATGKI
ncbi:MAG: ribonuclease P protein component [Patescibacteria group bacterium]